MKMDDRIDTTASRTAYTSAMGLKFHPSWATTPSSLVHCSSRNNSWMIRGNANWTHMNRNW